MRRRMICALLACVLAAPLIAPLPAYSAAHGGGDKKAKASFLPLDSLAVSVMRQGGRRGVLTVEIGVDSTNPAVRDKLDLYVAPLRSAYISALQPYALGLSPGAVPNADYIAMTLQRETDRVLKQRGVKLLIGSILVN